MKSSPFEGLPQQFMPIYIGVICLFIAGILIVYVFFLKNLQDLLKSVREPNRKLAPAKVWLLLIAFIPLFSIIPEMAGVKFSETGQTALTLFDSAISVFGLVWYFYIVNKIAESVSAELNSRKIPMIGKPTYNIGIFLCICNTLSLVSSVPYLAPIATMAGGAGLVAWIMYWFKTNEYKNILRSLPPDKEFDFE